MTNTLNLPNDEFPLGALDSPDIRDYTAEHILGGSGIVGALPKTIRLDISEGNQYAQRATFVACTCYATYHVAQVANELELDTKLTPDFLKGWELQGEFGTRIVQGDYVQTALKSIVKNGLILEDGTVHQISGYVRIEKSMLKEYLAMGNAIITSSKVTTTNFKKAKYEGIWGANDGIEKGGHAFALVGYEPGYFIASNSNGPKWGFYGDGTFKIREEDINAINSCYILHDVEDIEYLYKDVTEKSPHYEAMKWAKEEEIMTGYEDGSFGPDRPLTRAQAAELFFRFAEKYPEVFGNK